LQFPAYAGDGKYHADDTSDALKAAGFGDTAITIILVGNLKTDVYSSLPTVVQPFTRGPWGSECAPFHFDNLFTGQDVADAWKNLEKAKKDAVKKIVADIQKNRCSASGCPGHKSPKDTCHIWNSSAQDVFHERKKLLLLLLGTILHAVQDFYYHSNWVEQWDAAGKGGNIPTWDDAQGMADKGDKQAQGIMDGTHTGAYEAKNAPAGAQTHDQLNKDNPRSPEGSKLSSDGKTTLHVLANKAAEKASEQWIEDFRKCVNDEGLWKIIKECSGIDKTQAADYKKELNEVASLFVTAGHWDTDYGFLGTVLAPLAYDNWANRCATLSKRIFRELLKQFSDDYPGNKYLALAPMKPTEYGSPEKAAEELATVEGQLKRAAGKAPAGSPRALTEMAMGTVVDAEKALDERNPEDAFRHAAQARTEIATAREALEQKKAAPELVASLADAETAMGQVVADVGKAPVDLEVWSPSRVATDEAWTGLAVVKTPTGYDPYDGELIVNGQVTTAEHGSFPGPTMSTGVAVALFYGLAQIARDDRKVSPPINFEPPIKTATPSITSASSFVHPREPVVVVRGEGLDQLSKTRLVDPGGTAYPVKAEAGSSLQRICLTSPMPPGDYRLVAETADGQRVEAPDTVSVPRYAIKATPVTRVGDKGQITITSTSPRTTPVHVSGGEPQISLGQREADVSSELPGVLPFTAEKVGTFTVIARPESPDRTECEATALTPEQSKGWLSTVTRGLAGATQAAFTRSFFDLGSALLQERTKEQEKWLDKAKDLEKEAQKLEDEAAEAERAADAARAEAEKAKKTKERSEAEKKAKAKAAEAAAKRKAAAAKREQAAAAAAKGGDMDKAAENEEKAADDHRKAAEDLSASGETGTKLSDERKAAAAAEQRAAGDHRKAAQEALKAGDKDKAAGECDKAAEDYKRAAKDYGDVGAQGSRDSMSSSADAMKKAGDDIRKGK
jgi:hypothetical protein